MPPRAQLSRILAVNWYGYRQFIDVHGLTLITGANVSGKSALLDLIQFVILGEQTSRFNKAAAGSGGGFIEATGLFSQDDELDEVQKGAFSRDVRTGDQCQAMHVDELAIAIPIHGEDAAELSAGRHGGE